jgi:phosphate-selective porin OprO/OprP
MRAYLKITLFKSLWLPAWLGILAAPAASADTAGPFEPLTFDEGIVFTSPDGKFRSALRFRMQNLLEASSRSGSDLELDELRARVRRARIRLSGFAGDPRLTYQFQLSFSREDMDWSETRFPNVVRDANLTYALIQEPEQTFSVSFGQGKLPGNRQRVISSGELQFADRSLVNRVFNIDRDFGFQALYRRELWNLRGALSTGEGRNPSMVSDSGLGYVGRAEFLPLGSFLSREDYVEGDLKRHPSPRVSIGFTQALFRRSVRAGGTIGTVFTTTGNPTTGVALASDQSVSIWDLIAKYRGWSLQMEYARRTSPKGVLSADQALFEGSGFMVQSGYFFTEKFEGVVRFARVSPEARSKVDPRNVLMAQTTAGWNYYLQGHRVKLQGDLTRQSLSLDSWIARFSVELGI